MSYSEETRREAVRFAVEQANKHGWTVARSARTLDIPTSTLFRWLRAEYTCKVAITRRATWVPRVPEPSDLPDAMREGGEGA